MGRKKLSGLSLVTAQYKLDYQWWRLMLIPTDHNDCSKLNYQGLRKCHAIEALIELVRKKLLQSWGSPLCLLCHVIAVGGD